MKRRMIQWMAPVLAVMMAMTGCGTQKETKQSDPQTETGQTGTQESAGESAAQGEKTKLALWNVTVDGVDKGYEAIIDAYTTAHPEVEIEFYSYPETDYYSKLKSALSAGIGPDIYFTTGWNNLQTFVDSGHAENLDGKLDVTAFSSDALEVETINGSLYGAPGAYAQYLTVFYNKDLFEQAGVTVPATYDEFLKACDTLKAKGITPIAMGGQEATPYMFAWLVSCQALAPDYFEDIRSGKVSTFTDERFTKAMNAMKEWGEAGYYEDNYDGTTYTAQTLLFATGNAAMTLTGSWGYAEVMQQNEEINIGAFAFPGPEKTYGVRSVASGLSVNTGSQNKDAAIDFLNYTCTAEAMQTMVDAVDGIPVTDGVTCDNEVMQEVAKAPDYAAFPNIALNIAGTNSTNPQDVFTNNYLDVMSGKIDVNALAELMDKSWDPAAYAKLFQK